MEGGTGALTTEIWNSSPESKIYPLFFFFGCVGSSLMCTDFSLAAVSGGVLASHCGGVSRCGARALGLWASVVAAHGL